MTLEKQGKKYIYKRIYYVASITIDGLVEFDLLVWDDYTPIYFKAIDEAYLKRPSRIRVDAFSDSFEFCNSESEVGVRNFSILLGKSDILLLRD